MAVIKCGAGIEVNYKSTDVAQMFSDWWFTGEIPVMEETVKDIPKCRRCIGPDGKVVKRFCDFDIAVTQNLGLGEQRASVL